MKKGTEGYVLIYVLVVFILLGLACATVCTFALNGLKTQRAALENDRQRYAAEGLVEQAAARLLDNSAAVSWSGDGLDSMGAVWTSLENQYSALIQSMEEPDSAVTGLTVVQKKDDVLSPGDRWEEVEEAPGEYTGSFVTKIQTGEGGQQVSAALRMTLIVRITSRTVEEEGPADPDTGLPTIVTSTVYDYTVTSAQLSYDDYQVQAAEPEGGSGP